MTPSINRRDVLDKSWEEVWRVQTAIFWNSSQNQCSGNTKSKLILKFGTAVFLVLQVSTTSSAWETKQTKKKNIEKSSFWLLISSHLQPQALRCPYSSLRQLYVMSLPSRNPFFQTSFVCSTLVILYCQVWSSPCWCCFSWPPSLAAPIHLPFVSRSSVSA